MNIVSAFIVPGSPLPELCPDVAAWQEFKTAMQRAGEELRAAKPDVVLMYSTQWYAVLDELWLARPRSQDIHVDANWHELGEIPYDLRADVDLATACVQACRDQGIQAKGVDYDKFPIDTGTIVAASALGIGDESLPLVVVANNLYDDAAATEKLGSIATTCAKLQGKKVALVAVGLLSSSAFTTPIDYETDHIVKSEEDEWNRRFLALLEEGNKEAIDEIMPSYTNEARVDMGFKHFNWIMGALGGCFSSAEVYHYGALYGSGAAVIKLQP